MSFAWSPSDRYLARSRLRQFAEAHGHSDFTSLHRWSIEDLEGFWRAVEKDLGLVWRTPYDRVLDSSRGIPWTTWWLGGRMNYVDSALRHDPARTAIIFEGEEGAVRQLTYGELTAAVRRFAGGLRALGVKPGDRVGIFMPLTLECAIATLAVSAIGAIFTPIFSGYASDAIAGRLRDCEASVLITADGFRRRGQTIDMKQTADDAVDGAPSIRTVIVAPRLGREIRLREREVTWDFVMANGTEAAEFADTAPEDPYMLIYTSGTTGRPKGAVHVHGGFPVKAAQDQAHVFDLQKGDVLWWFTDIGWMMGPWLIAGGLINGATILLYDGAPDYPDAGRVWSIVERHRVTHLGISPTAIRGLMRAGEEPVKRHDRSSLFVLGSTGEPWNPEPWQWYFDAADRRAPLVNYSGGTECSGGILGCTTWTPLKPTGFAGAVPGIAADVFDQQGRPLRASVGELVIRKPWPGMTRGFWRDPEKYLATYWNRFPDVWVHGDWARIDDDGFWFIEGRSDDTLKVAGKRVGPAEVESAATAHAAVLEAAAIGVPHELKGEVIVLFVVLRAGYEAAFATLASEIADAVAERLGKPLRPDAVRFVRDLPKTRNAKILRRVIRAAYLGQDLGDVMALENPDAVAQISDLVPKGSVD